MDQSIVLKIGKHHLDLLNPTPDRIDLDAIEASLWNVRRFSGNPDALTVRQHTWLVARFARILNQPENMIQWCEHHDDSEGIIGDIPGPLKRYINDGMGRSAWFSIDQIEAKLDQAIASARGIEYPNADVRRHVHFYDKLAETVEWIFVLGNPVEDWCVQFKRWLDPHTARTFAETAKNLTPPRN